MVCYVCVCVFCLHFVLVPRGSWVEELNAHGYSCCGIDVQSFGRSEGYNKTRSYFNSFQDLVNDVKEFVSKLPELGGEKYSDLPKFIFGISMGGCIAVNMLQQCPNDYVGALLFAPMLSLERLSKEGLNPYLKPLVSVVNTLGPTLRMAHTPKNVKFPHLQKEFENGRESDAGFYIWEMSLLVMPRYFVRY